MKNISMRLTVLALCLTLTSLACAGIPQTINYQGYLKQADGTSVNTATKIKFSLYSSNPHRNNPLWNETQPAVDVNHGIYNVQLGTVTPISAPFDIRYWLGVSVNDGAELSPLQPLASVPYSFKSGCNPGDMIRCYTGTPGTLGAGICLDGLRTCPPDGSGYGSCVGEVTPHPITGCNYPSCADGVKNGAETDLDCGGGACAPCPNGKNCTINSDCTYGYCNSGICQTATCADYVKNGSESDVDCGGGVCPGCAIGKACIASSDCSSGSCNKGFCVAPTCTDGVKNGQETDVDCGGVCSYKCALGKQCLANADCQSAICTGGFCTPNLCVGITCTPLDQCHDVGTCNPSNGICSNPAKANGSACNDGNSCTQTDTCQTGTCTGGNPVNCTAMDQCHNVGTCNPATGVCNNPNKADGSACNDGNSCTQPDTCQAGTCVAPPAISGTVCSQNGGILCNGAGSCVACVTNANCPPTGNQCTTSVCSGYSCGSSNLAVGTSCNQGGGTRCDGAGICIP
jgi:hypothetical protein